MSDSQDRLTAAGLQAALVQHPFVTEIIYQPRLRSTNDLAKARATEGAPEGVLVITEEQTAGRGRMERRWWAPAGSALLTSLLFRPTVPPHKLEKIRHGGANGGQRQPVQELVMLCALAAADAITDLTCLTVELKWPNDLMVDGRKLAGLLAESIFRGDQLEAVVVGMGINVNTDFTNAPPFIAAATSLRLELGHPVDRLSLLLAYLDGIARRYTQLKEGHSPYDEWSRRLATLGQHVTARLGNQAAAAKGGPPQYLSGVAQGVDVDGALLLRTADGTVHRLLAADVSLREPTGTRSNLENGDPKHPMLI
jgi:BirA family biotin operon repressor/biotin-[acetyl-CoA-carboxylase] ligase